MVTWLLFFLSVNYPLSWSCVRTRPVLMLPLEMLDGYMTRLKAQWWTSPDIPPTLSATRTNSSESPQCGLHCVCGLQCEMKLLSGTMLIIDMSADGELAPTGIVQREYTLVHNHLLTYLDCLEPSLQPQVYWLLRAQISLLISVYKSSTFV